jgi:hypothetical protein
MVHIRPLPWHQGLHPCIEEIDAKCVKPRDDSLSYADVCCKSIASLVFLKASKKIEIPGPKIRRVVNDLSAIAL